MPPPQKIKMYYDPRGQVVHTVNPDGTEQRVIFGVPNGAPTAQGKVNFTPTPWESYTYDANDLTSGNYAFDTPKSALVDALGRTIKTTEHRATALAEDVVMQYEYDIRGNLLKVTDALDRTAFEYTYDLKPKMGEEDSGANVLKTVHIDNGTSRMLPDALGKTIMANDSRETVLMNTYDRLQRPLSSYTYNALSAPLQLIMVNVYGEGAVDALEHNLMGKLYEQYDGAGKIRLSDYDFKGNLLNKVRNVVKDDILKSSLNGYNPFYVDWSSFPSILDSTDYETDSQYDALNRITKIILPENVESDRKEIVPSYNKAGALEKVSYDEKEYVKHIAYNAKGQRLLIAFGNDLMSRYVYDAENFRLVRQRSEKYSVSSVGSTITYAYASGTNRQDDAYAYDLVGNILGIISSKTGCGVGGTDSLSRAFSYDPLYRLASASGRENVPGGGYPFPGWSDTSRNTDPNTTTAYTRYYSYDKMGNLEELQQTGSNAFTRVFDYTESSGVKVDNKLDGVTIGSDAYSYTYDVLGNILTENSNRHYLWDAFSRLMFFKNQVGSAEPSVEAQYLYDSGGNRVKKIVRKQGGDFEITVYIDGLFEYHTDETDEQNTVHIMDDKSRIATVRIGDAMGDSTPWEKYVLENNIGSSMFLLDENATMVNEQEYYPFGETSFGSYGKKKYQYCGKERDSESGLYYYGARFYSPWTCRFISVDPLASKFADLSPYNYAGNKPINKIDIDGLQENGRQGTPSGDGGNSNSKLNIDAIPESKKIDCHNTKGEGINDYSNKTLLEKLNGGTLSNKLSNKEINDIKEWVENNSPPKPGDPLAKMEILGTPNSGISGGRYGYARGRLHDGIDLKANIGTPVFATHDGIVGKVVNTQVEGEKWANREKWSSKDKNGGGNRIYISGTIDNSQVQTGYWHLSSVAINPDTGETFKSGDSVKAGTIIGFVGTTGNATANESSGPHLHLSMRVDGKSVNPENYFTTKFTKEGIAK